jgi:predicted metalloprotease with PDZ domain
VSSQSNGRFVEYLENPNNICLTLFIVQLTVTRSDRDQDLFFTVIGGTIDDTGGGIYVSKVEKDSIADKAGLSKGDEVGFSAFIFPVIFTTIL